MLKKLALILGFVLLTCALSSCALFVEESDGFIFTVNGIGTCSVRGIEGYEYGDEVIIPPTSPRGLKVTEISAYVVDGKYAKNVRHLIIPENVKVINEYAFFSRYLSNVTTITLPSTLEVLEDFWDPFYSNIRKVINNSDLQFDLDNNHGLSELQVVVGKDGEVTYLNTDTKEFFEIDDFLFGHYIKDDDGYVSGEYTLEAYLGTDQTIVLPKTVKGCEYTIHSMAGGKKVVIPEGKTEINSSAFARGGVTHVTIPASVVEIGSRAFFFCDSLEKVVFTEGSQIKRIGPDAFYNCEELAYFNLPEGIEEIDLSAFVSCPLLSSLNIPKSVKTIYPIEVLSTYDNLHFKEIKVAEGNEYYKDIDGNLYNYDATELIWYAWGKSQEKFVIPESVIRIGLNAFYKASSLTCVYIHEDVRYIERRAFGDCGSLTNVYYTGTEEKWATILIESDNSYLMNATICFNYVPEE